MELADIEQKDIAASYVVADDPSWPNPMWTDIPEADPRVRVIPVDGGATVNVVVTKDGKLHADGELRIETYDNITRGFGKPEPQIEEDEHEADS